MIEFFIPDPRGPKPQKRPFTVTVKGGRKVTYDRSANEKFHFNLQAKRYAPKEPLMGPVKVRLVFNMPVPKHSPKLLGEPCAKSPDVDNLAKLVLDSLNKVFYEDDRQIYFLTCEKVFSDRPGTFVEIQNL